MRKTVLFFLIISLIIVLLEMFGCVTLSRKQSLIKHIFIFLMLLYVFF